MHYLIQPGPALADRFAYLIGGLCHYLGAVFTRDRSAAPLTLLVHARLRRLAARFASLVARVEAGTLEPVRVRGARRTPQVRATALMPRGFGWLCELMPEGNVFATYLERQLAEAEYDVVLAKAPQAGGMLRAVLWMMGREVPEVLRPPKGASPVPRASREPPDRAEPVVVPDPPYREQPKGSHWPRSIWPTEADLKRAGRRIARAARRKIPPD